MAQLTHQQYDALERAVVKGTRVIIKRPGGRRHVVIPLTLHAREGREAIEARNPTTGHALTIYVDEIEQLEVLE